MLSLFFGGGMGEAIYTFSRAVIKQGYEVLEKLKFVKLKKNYTISPAGTCTTQNTSDHGIHLSSTWKDNDNFLPHNEIQKLFVKKHIRKLQINSSLTTDPSVTLSEAKHFYMNLYQSTSITAD